MDEVEVCKIKEDTPKIPKASVVENMQAGKIKEAEPKIPKASVVDDMQAGKIKEDEPKIPIMEGNLHESASKEDCVEKFKSLLENNPEQIHSMDVNNDTPFSTAALSDKSPLDKMAVLLDCGAGTEDLTTKHLQKICTSASVDVLKFILDNNLKTIADFDVTAYFECCKSHKDGVEKLQLLISRGGDLNIQDDEGLSLLHVSCEHGSWDVIKYLVMSGLEVNEKDRYGRTGLYYCCCSTDSQVVEKLEYLCEHGGDLFTLTEQGESLLHAAGLSGRLVTVKYLVTKGFDIHTQDMAGRTALHACSWNQVEQLPILQYLISNKPNIEAFDYCDHNVFHYFCERGSLDAVKYLVENGVSLHTEGQLDQTPVFYCCQSQVEALEKLQYLEELGCDIHSKDRRKCSVLHEACRWQNLEFVKYLTSRKLRVNDVDRSHENCLFYCCLSYIEPVEKLQYFWNNGGNFWDTDKSGKTLLHHACGTFSKYEVIKFLLEKGLDVNYESNKGRKPLYSACRNGFGIEASECIDRIKYLLNNGATMTEDERLFYIETSGIDDVVDFLKTLQINDTKTSDNKISDDKTSDTKIMGKI